MNLKTVRRRVACGAAGLLVAAGGSVAAAGPAHGEAATVLAIKVTSADVRVPENSTAMSGVRLAAAPAENVTVTVTAGSGDADLTVSAGATLTFTPQNWDTPQNVRIAAAADGDAVQGERVLTLTAKNLDPVEVTVGEIDTQIAANQDIADFTTQYNKIKDPANGYFSPEGVPYHSVETLMVEAPDHGHETTSEALAFYIWLEAQYGRVTENWSPFNTAWDITEQYIIPSEENQPGGMETYDPSDPADYAPEFNQPNEYPSPLDPDIEAGEDPLAEELSSTYGTGTMYAMHWLLDVDNVYGFADATGECGGDDTVTYINTYQRGPQESVWETVPHPSCETGEYGSDDGAGYPPIFIEDGAAGQWRYTAAPDADARAVQATYWALTWATEQGNQGQITESVERAAKLGDYLRYAMYDKYFKEPGCTSPTCPAGSGKSSSAYLLNWYFAWGGDIGGEWAWRIGASHFHGGYQNPLAAWAMSPEGPAALQPESSTAPEDWATSLTRQVQFYAWLQSAEGAIAGGATNSWDGAYASPPGNLPQFFGMTYDVDPVYHDPPSNRWFGFQAWGMQRLAEYYYVTGDSLAKRVMDNWVEWAISETTLGDGGEFEFPNEMTWSGAPAGDFSSESGTPPANSGLHVSVTNHTNDVGVASAYARTLIYYAAREGAALGAEAQETAKGLLDRMLLLQDDLGISVPETRADYDRFDDQYDSGTQQGLYIPEDFNGTMPNGDEINSDSTFLSIRSFYEDDPAWDQVQAYLDGGDAPTFNYHRFWAQADFAMALADYAEFFEE